MHGRILKRMRELVRRRRYVMTTHADEEADEDGLSVLDIESVILTVQSSNDKGIVKLTSGSTLSVAKRLMVAARLPSQSSVCLAACIF